MSENVDLRKLRGLVATIVISGSVDDLYHQAFCDLRSWCDRNGYHSLEWRTIPAQLVEAGRDSALAHAMQENYDFCLQIDADAAPIPENAVEHILRAAYALQPNADIMGAYCQLKHPPYLPTIDTGTGTWEPHYPGEGILPVIRTGAHFVLVKTPVLARFGPPWFKTRRSMRPLDALIDVDNFARIKFDGANPLREHPAWGRLEALTREEAGGVVSQVGEDSGFCDAAKAAGANIYVDTSLVVGHVAKRIITPYDLRDAFLEREEKVKAAVGVLS